MTAAVSAFELAVARLGARARLIERALHDTGSWQLLAPGVRIPLRREILADDRRIVFTGYLTREASLSGPGDLICAGECAAIVTLPGALRGPCRITVSLGLREAAVVLE